jgi:hypothetical protein
MTIDLTGGLAADWESVFATKPEDPEMRESINAWIWDDSGTFGIPRIGVEAVSAQWGNHDLQVNLAFADGRVYNMFGPGDSHSPFAADGRPRILGTGPLSFEVVEPYRHLRMTFDGTAVATTVQAQADGWIPGVGPGERVPVRAEIDIRPAVPPWENGSTSEEAQRILSTQDEGYLMGHPWRFEQLCRATGTITVGGEEHQLNGGANRVRRQSVRRTAKLWGHAWQAGLFPSGRGFSYIAYPPRTDRKDTYNEGYLFEGDGELIPARVIRPPFLRTLTPQGEDVSLVLETAKGTVEIGGETLMSTFMVMGPESGSLQLQQALVRYTWNGESGTGMMERSITPDSLASEPA